MAKLIYAVTALALGALVSGFFIDSSTVPLFASIGSSALVMLLVLIGWSRRIRKGMDLFDDEDQEVEIAEIADRDEDEHGAFKPAGDDRESVKVGAAEATTVFDVDALDAEPAAVNPSAAKSARAPATRRKPAPRTPTSKAAGAKPKAAAASRKPAASKKKAPAAKAKPRAARTAARTADRPGRVLVIPGRSRYHRPGCRFAKGDQIREVSETTAQRRGYEPCNICGS